MHRYLLCLSSTAARFASLGRGPDGGAGAGLGGGGAGTGRGAGVGGGGAGAGLGVLLPRRRLVLPRRRLVLLPRRRLVLPRRRLVELDFVLTFLLRLRLDSISVSSASCRSKRAELLTS